jgi:hypothetical protein
MAYDPLDRSQWDEKQEDLVRRRQAVHAQADEIAYHAGKVRGSRGDYHTPPWMAHLHEIAPNMANPEQFAAAHRYGQTEGYVEHSHDIIGDEFTPRAEKLAKEAHAARQAMEGADVSFKARAMMVAAGRSRYPVSPSARRTKLAHARFNEVQGRANDFQAELDSRLGEVEEMRQSLVNSPWKPRH